MFGRHWRNERTSQIKQIIGRMKRRRATFAQIILTLKKQENEVDSLKEIDTFKRDGKGVRKMGAYAKKYSKVDSEPGEMADLSALLEVSIEQIGSRVRGRPPVYENTEEGLQAFLEATRGYFEYIRDANSVNEEKLIPDVEGWAIFIGVTRQTVLSYAKRGDAWNEAIEYIKDSKKAACFPFQNSARGLS